MSRVVDSFIVTGTNSAVLYCDKAAVARLIVTTGISVLCFYGFRAASNQVITTTVLQSKMGAVSLTFKIDHSMFPCIFLQITATLEIKLPIQGSIQACASHPLTSILLRLYVFFAKKESRRRVLCIPGK